MRMNLGSKGWVPQGYQRLGRLEARGWCDLTVARQPETGELCVVRRPQAAYARAMELQAQWQAESVSVMKHALHPGLLRLLDHGQQSGALFTVQELFVGESLEVLLSGRLGGLPERAACALAVRVAEVLAHLHLHRWVHGAVHPGHVLLSSDGRVALLSPGKHRLWAGQRAALGNQAAGNDALTVAFQPPVELLGQTASDVWALAALLRSLLQGSELSPVPTSEPVQRLLRQMMEPPSLAIGEALAQLRAVVEPMPRLDVLAMRLAAEAPKRPVADLLAQLKLSEPGPRG